MRVRRRITKAYFDLARFQYAPLIHQLAFRIGAKNILIEELKNKALEELLKCMICYNHTGSFMTFLYSRLSGVFRHMRDAENRFKRIEIIPIDMMIDLSEHNVNSDLKLIIKDLMECLTCMERNVIVGSFFGKETMREISQKYGIVPSTVHRIKHKAIDKMKRLCII